MSESDLFQLLQQCQFITISANKLKIILASWLDFLIQEQLFSTIWLKLPADLLLILDLLSQQKYLQQVYLYGEFPSRILHKKMISVDITPQTSLQREIFLVIRADRFSGLIFARSLEKEKFQLTFNFESDLCQKFLSRLQDAIAISDLTTLEVLTGNTLAGWSKSIEPKLITNLLLKQTENLQEIEDEKDVVDLQIIKNTLTIQDDFLEHLTEEMRQPLTNMKTALTLLQSPTLKPAQRQLYMEMVKSQWQFYYALWSALVEWVQIKKIHQQVNFSQVSCELELVLFNVVSLYQSIAQDKTIFLEYSIPTGLPKVCCPEFYLQRILSHLLDNSLKFTPSGGKISLSCQINSNNNLELIILDTGIGIRNNELTKIFNSFYRGHNPHNKDSLSLGLGLTLVKRLLEHCNGFIDVKSTPNQGSSFKVVIPVSLDLPS
jgi:hypothetical protein